MLIGSPLVLTSIPASGWQFKNAHLISRLQSAVAGDADKCGGLHADYRTAWQRGSRSVMVAEGSGTNHERLRVSMGSTRKKAIGQRGSWFATIDGESIPCAHDHWTRLQNGSLVYNDPYCYPEDAKWAPFLSALREQKRAILTKDTLPNDAMVFERLGYIALFRIDHVIVESGTLRFQFVERITDLE